MIARLKLPLNVLALLVLVLQPLNVFADDSLAKLTAFTRNLTTFTTSFEQTVYDAESQPLQSSKGTASLKRPGKFTWHYTEPSEQLIIADGDKVWIYDHDLEQVTVSPLGERAAGTPLALLMGDVPLEQEFELKTLGVSDAIEWYELVPLSKENDFETLYLGLQEDTLAVMELRDNFGQATQIRFSDFKSNIPLDDAAFDFTPPAGVDVIGEG